MTVLQIIALCATGFCFVAMLLHFIRIIRLGKPKDLSKKSGDVAKGVTYSATIAMMPNNKESAHKHIFDYLIGIIFHLGTFLALLIFILSFFPFFLKWLTGYQWIHGFVIMAQLTTSFAGLILFCKRIIVQSLRKLSNPDDFISNAVTTLFQFASAYYLLSYLNPIAFNLYYIAAILLFLYMPVGKLKHCLYFFSARYHLGFFYGWRNVWPPAKKK
ncbi:hypothetical protein LJB75_00035 [Bacteroidales bacterium OttesenSCG-928-L19]|nr:hypothetical protein [Bacteroidales bacterium OttesenSCG-928-L19]